METSRLGGIPHGEMSKEAQTAMWHQQYHHHDSGIMSGATTTTHSIKGDDADLATCAIPELTKLLNDEGQVSNSVMWRHFV